jgi:hypothetical protein
VAVPPRLRRSPGTTSRTCLTRSSRSSSRRSRPPIATPARAGWSRRHHAPPPLPRRPRRAGQRCPRAVRAVQDRHEAGAPLGARVGRGQPLRLRCCGRHRAYYGVGRRVGRRHPSRRRDLRTGGRRSLDGDADGVGRRVGRRRPSRSRDLRAGRIAEERGRTVHYTDVKAYTTILRSGV